MRKGYNNESYRIHLLRFFFCRIESNGDKVISVDGVLLTNKKIDITYVNIHFVLYYELARYSLCVFLDWLMKIFERKWKSTKQPKKFY